jgi:hypothetical protein
MPTCLSPLARSGVKRPAYITDVDHDSLKKNRSADFGSQLRLNNFRGPQLSMMLRCRSGIEAGRRIQHLAQWSHYLAGLQKACPIDKQQTI